MDNDVTEGEAIIPEEDFREAIAACCEDPQLKRYFTLAPTGAKLFIGLGFYSTHFGDRVDPQQYAECQAEIEPALTINDLKYLIRFEDDRNTKQYLRTLLAKREEEEAAGQVEEGEAVAYSAEDPMPVPRRRRRRRGASAAVQWAMRGDRWRLLPTLCRGAALLAIAIGGAALVYFNRDKIDVDWRALRITQPDGTETQVSHPEPVVTNVAVASVEPPKFEARNIPAEPAKAPADNVTTDRQAAVGPAVVQAIRSPSEVPEVVATPTNLVVAQAIPEPHAADTGQTAPGRSRRSRIVLTDGKRIIRRPGGKIEVPRVFSSIGAGVKPFWVYGPSPEVEAEKERKARMEWESLRRKAQLSD